MSFATVSTFLGFYLLQVPPSKRDKREKEVRSGRNRIMIIGDNESESSDEKSDSSDNDSEKSDEGCGRDSLFKKADNTSTSETKTGPAYNPRGRHDDRQRARQ